MRWLTSAICCLSVVFMTGCQNWGGGGYPLQSMSRVPPPGTGSYTVPNNYYNSAPANTQTSMAPAAPMSTVGMPPTQLTAAASTPENSYMFSDASVVSTQYTAPANPYSSAPVEYLASPISNQATASGVQPVSASSMTPGGAFMPGTTITPPDNLQWQP